jgi:hypothetical protein
MLVDGGLLEIRANLNIRFPVGVLGRGVTGSRVIQYLKDVDQSFSWRASTKRRHKTGNRFELKSSSDTGIRFSDFDQCGVVVLASPPPHELLAKFFIERGVSVVSLSDDLEDTIRLLDLDDVARQSKTTLAVGMAASPGLTGLLVGHLACDFDLIDEAHIALHGTGGPSCAHQHHKALSGWSIGWHDRAWLTRPAGSGRELCWFPDPIGGRDCYRAEMPDPVLIRHAMPHLQRISARLSATRRDRLTSRLPMLIPPHAEGGLGGIRVEVRGWKGGSRSVDVVGVVGRVGQVAGVIAGAVSHEIATCGITESGVITLGSPSVPNERLLSAVQRSGIHLQKLLEN